MRALSTIFAALLLVAAASFTAPAAHAAVAVSAAVGVGGPVGVDVFYSHLSPYGHWVERPNYGWVFLPGSIGAGWRPYTAGRWVYTDYGWTWDAAASEPWGWATYHYGRWYDDPDYGWGWVPGTDWGPAWVAWQSGGGYLGWAALPPAVGWNAGVGLQLGGLDLSVGLSPASYCFVPQRSFLAANVGAFVVGSARNVAILHTTRNVTNYSMVDHRVFNRSLQVADVERATGQRVHSLRVANMNEARAARLSGSTLAMYHPAVERRADVRTPRDLAPHSVITSPAERRGVAVAHDRRPAPTHNAVAHRPPAGAVHRARPAPPAAREHRAVPPSNEHRAPANVPHRAPASAVHHNSAPAAAARDHRAPVNAAAEHRAVEPHAARRVNPAETHHTAPPPEHRNEARTVEHHQAPPPAEHRASAPPAEHHASAPPPAEHHASAPPPEHHEAHAGPPPAAQRHASPPPQHSAAHPQPPKPESHGGGEHHEGGR